MTTPEAVAPGARRILLLGCPGSGKTTLARELARATGLPLHHLDDAYWAAHWRRPDPAVWARRQLALTAGDRWIIDGNHLPTIELRARRAELVVLLDAAAPRCLYRVLRRAWRIGRRGQWDALPARVRAQARAGIPVRAGHDLPRLLCLIARFRRRSWWTVVDRARTNPDTALVVAVVPGTSARRVRRVRTGLARRGVPARVVPLSAVPALVRTAHGPPADREKE